MTCSTPPRYFKLRVSPAPPAPGPRSGGPSLPMPAWLSSVSSPQRLTHRKAVPTVIVRSHVQEMGIQQPLAQENWLGGTEYASWGQAWVWSHSPVLALYFIFFPIILWLSGSLPKDLKAISYLETSFKILARVISQWTLDPIT